ncbi:leucine-rich repeat domain-containing protein [Anaeromicropila populeti]|uniref:Leucine Rich repeat-containing protein n=1 Tax=Anaeromicropila populeti TaxID=37658 RepID=A0A1I6JXR5_9FIRM|nr:leucine-rich repeat domain-containing protein [Anaeromicropila populeti]SFR83769.1 hypothetical protein SAMN05661086_02059 [Anaeromicropila populeti]
MAVHFQEKCIKKAARRAAHKLLLPLTPSDLEKIRALFIDVKQTELSLKDLEFFPNITICYIFSTKGWFFQLKDDSSLKCLSKLEILSLANCTYNEAAPLNLPDIKTLALENTCFKNLEFLSLLPKLEDLSLSGRSFHNIDFLKDLNSLTCLEIAHTCIKDITPLQNFTNLKELYFEDNSITDYSITRTLKELDLLSIDGVEIPKEEFLKQTH